MKTQELIYSIAIFAVIGIIGCIYISIKQKRDLKKAEKGEDMARLKALVGRTLPSETEYQVAYAHWKKSEYRGRRTITTYYCYALAFDTDRLIVIPVTFDEDNDMTAHEPVFFTGETLGIAKVAVAKHTDREEIKRVEVILHDKQGKEIIQFYVDAANTREDRAPKSKENGGAPGASFLLPLISLVLGILCGAVQIMRLQAGNVRLFF